MSKLAKTFNIFSIAFLTLFALFALIVGWLNPDAGGETGLLFFAVSYCCALVPLGLLSAVRLAWVNRNHLSNIFVSADAIIARAGSHPRPTDFYMTDTFHTDELEDAL